MPTLELNETIPRAEEFLWNPEEQRKFDDITTWAAEMLDGNMRTPFEFTFDGRELYGRDDMPLGPVFEDAIVDAKRKAQNDPSLKFLVRRSTIEYGEYQDMKAMAKGDAPNTEIVVSDFPEELMQSDHDVEGMNVKRKQTMLRVITRRPDGTISMVSQSLEGSDREGLEAIYNYLGEPAEEGELLGQRRRMDLDSIDQEFLIDHLVGVYDRRLEEKNGGSYKAGWRLPTERAHINTYDFVLAQPDLLHAFIKKSDLNSQALLGFAAAMRQRFENKINPSDVNGDLLTLPHHGNPMVEMYHAAALAIAEGRTFSGCGVSIGANGELSTEEQLKALGYNNEDDDQGTCEFTSKKCPICEAENVKTVVTSTHITGACGCSVRK